MKREALTEKQQHTAEEIAKGTNGITAVMKHYNCGGKKPKVSASVILNKLYKTPAFKNELNRQKTLVQEIILTEGRKLVDILEELFPKVERARILVEIARTGDIKSKLEALKEINKIEGAYPIQELEQPQIGGLQIVMVKVKPGEERKELKEGEKLPVIEEAEVKEPAGKEDNESG